jgi:hypothetical protein
MQVGYGEYDDGVGGLHGSIGQDGDLSYPNSESNSGAMYETGNIQSGSSEHGSNDAHSPLSEGSFESQSAITGGEIYGYGSLDHSYGTDAGSGMAPVTNSCRKTECVTNMYTGPEVNLQNDCCCTSGGNCASMHCDYTEWVCKPDPWATPTTHPPTNSHESSYYASSNYEFQYTTGSHAGMTSDHFSGGLNTQSSTPDYEECVMSLCGQSSQI